MLFSRNTGVLLGQLLLPALFALTSGELAPAQTPEQTAHSGLSDTQPSGSHPEGSDAGGSEVRLQELPGNFLLDELPRDTIFEWKEEVTLPANSTSTDVGECTISYKSDDIARLVPALHLVPGSVKSENYTFPCFAGSTDLCGGEKVSFQMKSPAGFVFGLFCREESFSRCYLGMMKVVRAFGPEKEPIPE